MQCYTKGALSQMLQEIKCSVNQTQNRHKFLLISSTKYEILLASWPLAVALMYAVAMCIKNAGFILFSARMNCLGFRNGKHYVLLLLRYLDVSKGDVQRYVHAGRL